MARRVDQIQLIGLAVVRMIIQRDGPGLDGDAALLLQLHVVQHLGMELPLGDGIGQLQQPVGQGGFAVIDVGDDGKIANFRTVSHNGSLLQ